MKSNIQDAWIVGEGKYEGHRLIMRQNVGARPLIGDGRYPFRVGIAIPFISPQKDGMPDGDEMNVLERIENQICDYFETEQTGVLCFVFTTWGMREFIIYAVTDGVTDLIESLSQYFLQYDIQHYIQQDKGWEVYKQWDS